MLRRKRDKGLCGTCRTLGTTSPGREVTLLTKEQIQMSRDRDDRDDVTGGGGGAGTGGGETGAGGGGGGGGGEAGGTRGGAAIGRTTGMRPCADHVSLAV